jgi:lipopolysaccharide biosynthesis glycosyltransferase
VRDIKLLWDEDLNGKSIGVVADLGFQGEFKRRFIYDLEGNPKQLFMHAGVYLLNCQKWREQKTTEKLLALAFEKKDKLWIILEELFSLYFEDDYQLLDCRYGMIDGRINTNEINADKITPEYLNNEWKEVVVMHFAGSAKPWNTCKPAVLNQPSVFFRLFWTYAQMTPYCKELEMRMMENLHKSKDFKYKYKFFGIPVLTVRAKKGNITYKLFGFIPFLKRKGK